MCTVHQPPRGECRSGSRTGYILPTHVLILYISACNGRQRSQRPNAAHSTPLPHRAQDSERLLTLHSASKKHSIHRPPSQPSTSATSILNTVYHVDSSEEGRSRQKGGQCHQVCRIEQVSVYLLKDLRLHSVPVY
jgi:hypothetical protein